MILPMCVCVCVCMCVCVCVHARAYVCGASPFWLSLCVPLCLSKSLSLAVSVHHGSDPAFLWTSAGCTARLCSFLLKLTPNESVKFKAQCHFCRQAFHDPASISPCYTLLCPNVHCDRRHLPKWTTRDGWERCEYELQNSLIVFV